MKEGKLSPVPAFSLVLCWVIFNLIVVILTASKFNLILYCVPFLLNIFILGVKLFLELTGIQDTLLRWWGNLPFFTHVGIIGICSFWILTLSYAILPNVLKKDYERSR
jgi:hypothetical protein